MTAGQREAVGKQADGCDSLGRGLGWFRVLATYKHHPQCQFEPITANHQNQINHSSDNVGGMSAVIVGSDPTQRQIIRTHRASVCQTI